MAPAIYPEVMGPYDGSFRLLTRMPRKTVASFLDSTRIPPGLIVSDNFTIITNDGTSNDQRNWVPAAKPANRGRRYFEVTGLAGTTDYNGYIGFVYESTLPTYGDGNNPVFGANAGIRGVGTLWTNNTETLTGLPTFGSGDTAMVVYERETGKVWYGVNGTWHSDPSGAATYTMSEAVGSSDDIYPVFQARGQTDSVKVRLDDADFIYELPTGTVGYLDDVYDAFVEVYNLLGVAVVKPDADSATVYDMRGLTVVKSADEAVTVYNISAVAILRAA